MNKVLERFDDQLVRGTYMYGSSESEMLYADPEHTVEIKTSVAKELFLKGCLIAFASESKLPRLICLERYVREAR